MHILKIMPQLFFMNLSKGFTDGITNNTRKEKKIRSNLWQFEKYPQIILRAQ